MTRPKLVFCANILRYDCGCQLEWQFIGAFSHIPEYHVIPCREHAGIAGDGRKMMEEIAEEDWEHITSEVRK